MNVSTASVKRAARRASETGAGVCTASTWQPRARRASFAHMKHWIVYVLRCADGSLYTGITNDLRRRLAAHRAGTASRYTRARGPVRVVHREPALDRGAALR